MSTAPLHFAIAAQATRVSAQWARRLVAVLCLTVLSAWCAPAIAAGWTAADLPAGMEPSAVIVGAMVDATSYDPTSDTPMINALFSPSVTVSIADLDPNGAYTVPDGYIFVPVYPALNYSISMLKLFASQEVEIQDIDAYLQSIALFGDGSTTYSTDDLVFTDFSTVIALALESDAVSSNATLKSFFDGLPKYMIGPAEQLQALLDNATSFGSALGLQPDDPGLLAILAAIEEGTIDLTPDPTEDTAAIYDAIGAHQQARLRNLVNTQPDLVGVVIAGEAATSDTADSPVTGYAPFSFGHDGIKLSRRGHGWFDLSASYGLPVATEADLLGVVGAHTNLGKGVVVGGMVEFDRADSGAVTGTGWLAGPYLVARVPDLFNLDARLLYGRVSDTGEVLGLGDESLDSERLLASMALTHPIALGDVTLSPRLAASYAAERSAAYTTDLGSDIAGVETGIAQIDAGLDAAFALGDVAVTTGLAASWTETLVGEAGDDGLTGKASLGLDWALSDAASLSVDLGLAGIGGSARTGTIRAGLTASY